MYAVEALAGGSRVLCWGCCVALRVPRERRFRVTGEWNVCSGCGQD